MKPAEFWSLTPYESAIWCRQATEREGTAYKIAVFGAWHSAVFARQKKVPNLEKIMRRFDRSEPVKPQSAASLLAKVRALNAAFGGRDLSGGKNG